MRLFTGIETPASIADGLAPFLQWTTPSNLHITTKFIGEFPDARLDELLNALQPLALRRAFPITVAGFGWYPNPHAPRTFFAAVQRDPDLTALAHDTDQVLQALGVPSEKRPYSPHLTLARMRADFPLAEVRRAIAALESADFGRFTATGFHLYRSQSGPNGSVYTKLSEIAFAE